MPLLPPQRPAAPWPEDWQPYTTGGLYKPDTGNPYRPGSSPPTPGTKPPPTIDELLGGLYPGETQNNRAPHPLMAFLKTPHGLAFLQALHSLLMKPR